RSALHKLSEEVGLAVPSDSGPGGTWPVLPLGLVMPPNLVAPLLSVLRRNAAASDPLVSDGAGPCGYDRLVRVLAGWADTVNRRELLRILGAAPTAGTVGLLGGLDPDEQDRVFGALVRPVRVDEQVIASFETMLTTARTQ